jgi:hypothetical protein
MRADTPVGRLVGALARRPAIPAASTRPSIHADTPVGRLVGALARTDSHREADHQALPYRDRQAPTSRPNHRPPASWPSLLIIIAATALVIISVPAARDYLHHHSTAPPTTARATPTPPRATPTPPPTHAVIIRITGYQATVTVSTQDDSSVLLQGTLARGEVRTYDESNLVVTVDPAQGVDVEINGRLVSAGKTGYQVYSE